MSTLAAIRLRGVRRERGVLDVLRADAEDHAPAHVAAERRPRGERLAVHVSPCAPKRRRAAVRRSSSAPTRFIAGRADELGDEQVGRLVVELLRRVDLLQEPVAHHGDAVAERHRLDLVVRDVDRRHLEVALEPRDLGAHLHAQLRVEVRERLVHQERLRLAHDRAAHRDSLALAAGERARALRQHVRRARAPARRSPTRVAADLGRGTFASSARTPCS